MPIVALNRRIWSRIIARMFRKEPTSPVRRPSLSLFDVEQRATPGSILEATIGVPLLGLILPPVAEPTEPAIVVTTRGLPDQSNLAEDAVPPIADQSEESTSIALPSTTGDGFALESPIDDSLLADAQMLESEGYLGNLSAVNVDSVAPPSGGASGGGPSDNSANASQNSLSAQTSASSNQSLILNSALSSRATQAAQAPTGPVEDQPGIVASSSDSSSASLAASQASLAQFGFVSRTPLQGSASPITSSSSFVPRSQQGQFGVNAGNSHSSHSSVAGENTFGNSRVGNLGRTTIANPTPVAGSISPSTLVGGHSRDSLSGSIAAATSFKPSALSANPIAMAGTVNPVLASSINDSGTTEPVASTSTAASTVVDSGGTGTIRPFDSPGGDGGSSAGGDGGSGSGGPGTGGPGSGGPGSGDPGSGGPGSGGSGGSGGGSSPDTLTGSFTFTLTETGQDDQGTYTLKDTGSANLPGPDPDTYGTITSQLHRGPGDVSSSDPSTTQTLSFDPNGTGLLLGFDIDGYNASVYNIAVANATTYNLTATGSDTFTDSETDTTDTYPSSNESDVDVDTYTDQGSSTFSLVVTGTGSSRTSTFNDIVPTTFTMSIPTPITTIRMGSRIPMSMSIRYRKRYGCLDGGVRWDTDADIVLGRRQYQRYRHRCRH